MGTICCSDSRRGAVRRFHNRNGLDYVEVDDKDQRRLYVYFLGRLPPELRDDRPGLERHLRIDGGSRVTGIRVLDVDPQRSEDPERDDYLVVRLDRYGDFSTYRLSLVDVADVDPHYASSAFSFKIDCPSDLDCRPAQECAPPLLPQPDINYLAKDYASFRQLILDRLALLMPQWQERHVPDLGVVLAELLAYTGDYLSYYQDAVATEAYLDTARQRISVRRHARLVDYHLHEGCNARVWIVIETSQDLSLQAGEVGFLTGLNPPNPVPTVLSADALQAVPAISGEYFEPLLSDPSAMLHWRAAHNRIRFYTWGRRECCLPKGTTQATLLDAWAAGTAGQPGRALQLQPGDVLIFEEVRGAHTGADADADPARRCAVRLTRVAPVEDPLYPLPQAAGETAQSRPTPLLEIEWAEADALPFALCLSALGAAPDCAYLQDVSVARGNVVLADHGRSLPEEALGVVPAGVGEVCCVCEGHPSELQLLPARCDWTLAKLPLTHRQPCPTASVPASASLAQDPRAALPQLQLHDSDGGTWLPQNDLLASSAVDRHVVAEIDNDGVARLRFGDGELGRQPKAGLGVSARYRIGLGPRGNVGAESINRLVLQQTSLSGIALTLRNPLPAIGGIAPEPLAEARLYAPSAFRKRLERAVIADDYARLAERSPKVQRASAELVWTGSWYEADVAVDAWKQAPAPQDLLRDIEGSLHRYRRMGHDLHLEQAIYVPIDLALDVCVLPGHARGQVRAALLDRFSARLRRDGRPGWFHPDRLSFGEGLRLSAIVAEAQAVEGIECVRVRRLQRLFEAPNRELDNGLLPLAGHEIARLDNDPNYPERGRLEIIVQGGR